MFVRSNVPLLQNYTAPHTHVNLHLALLSCDSDAPSVQKWRQALSFSFRLRLLRIPVFEMKTGNQMWLLRITSVQSTVVKSRNCCVFYIFVFMAIVKVLTAQNFLKKWFVKFLSSWNRLFEIWLTRLFLTVSVTKRSIVGWRHLQFRLLYKHTDRLSAVHTQCLVSVFVRLKQNRFANSVWVVCTSCTTVR